MTASHKESSSCTLMAAIVASRGGGKATVANKKFRTHNASTLYARHSGAASPRAVTVMVDLTGMSE